MSAKFDLLTAIQFKRYKSFETQRLFRLPLHDNILLIIGKNNSGKSSAADVIESALRRKVSNDQIQGIRYSFLIENENLETGYLEPGQGENPSMSYLYSRQYLEKEITLEKDAIGPYRVAREQKDINLQDRFEYIEGWNAVARSYDGALNSICVRRINADRDIVAELASNSEEVGANGIGATNLVRKFLLLDTYKESYVERIILNELNAIMEGDGHFTNIRIQQIGVSENDSKWEIFLEEGERRFALSKSGSGLKTILLILINLYLLPETREYLTKNIVYIFEEIENNLHPALQRRIFDYLYDYSTANNIKVVITTHSHIAINAFYGREKATICHVIKKDGKSDILSISSSKGKNDILDDLGVKASDMFQSDGIIWVEGPSDRIYILKWLRIFTDFNLLEGTDFQFMYYGGKLLSHYSAEAEKYNDLIDILTTNRHAAIVIDSDKTDQSQSINDTKKRIKEEFKNKKLFYWITEGKEIENYLPVEAINQVHNSSLSQIDQYKKFPEYIADYDEYFSMKKVEYARKYSEYITSENSDGILDLRKKIQELYLVLQAWKIS